MAKAFKKVVAVLLSVLMVVTALPFTTFTSFAADGDEYTEIDAAITTYETKMSEMLENTSEHKYPYSNMSAAYNAYVKANKLRDAYKYGNDSAAKDQFASAAQELNNAINNMQPWAYTKPSTVIPSFPDTPSTGTDSMEQFVGKYIDNIIYSANDVSGTAKENSAPTGYAANSLTSGGEFYVSVYYPTKTVVLYDGITAPKIPVMMSFKGNKATTLAKNCDYILYGLYPSKTDQGKADRDDIFMIGKGKGPGNGWKFGGADGSYPAFSCDFDYTANHGNREVAVDSTNSAGGHSCIGNNHFTKGNWRNLMYGSSALTISDCFNGAGSKAWNTIPWYYGGAQSGKNDTVAPEQWSITGNLGQASPDHSVYAVNYSLILTALKNARNKLIATGFSVTNYKQGGLSSLLSAIDAAEAYDISSKNFANDTANLVTTTGNEIKAAADTLNNAATTADIDYTDLRNAMINPELDVNKSAKTKYLKGNENNKNYTEETWTPFAEAYKEAQDFFAAILTNGYTMSADAQKALADRIVLAEDELVINKILVPTTDLDVILDNAYAIVANKRYFNTSDYTNSGIEALVTNCVTDIWGSMENYGVDSEKLEDSEEARAKVASYIAPLEAAVTANQLNYDSTIPALAHSMNSALTEAAGYEQNKSDYANYAELQTAVNNANSLKTRFNGKVFDPHVPGQTKSAISDYIEYTTEIINSIRTLRPAFDKIENGTIANPGTKDTLSFSMNEDRFKLDWTRTNGIIFFKTTRDAVQWKLPVNYFTWSTNQDHDACLDSINFVADPNNSSRELTSKWALLGQTPSGYAIDQAVCNQYQGGMNIQNANIKLSMENIKVSSSSTTNFAKTIEGNDISDKNTDLTGLLETTQGTEKISGAITAKNGSTVFNADGVIKVPATTGAPSIGTTVSNKSMPFNTSADGDGSNGQLGFVYYFRFNGGVAWAGYAYEQKHYDQKIYVVDLSIYKEVIADVEAMAPNANNYTTASWNTLMQALTAAKAEMDYGNMTYKEICDECDARYVALWNARQNLKAPASNADLKAAIEECKSTYANSESLCSPASWEAFSTAYRNAMSALDGKYSDTGIRDFASDDADVLAEIKNLADTLRAAKDALAYRIQFDMLNQQAYGVVNGIENNKYTLESIVAVKNALANMPNLNMPEEERLTHYSDDKELVQQVNDEIVAIFDLKKLLVEATTATEVLDAAKVDAKAKFSDPDAYNLDNIQSILDTLTAYKAVELPNYINGNVSVMGAQYNSQAEADAACTDALSGVQIQEYTVTRNDDNGNETVIGTYPYGTEVTVNSATGEVVDWYYSCISNTTNAAEKLFSTGDGVTFVVKGNTYLRTKKADTEDTKKVTYVNALNGRTYDVQYVPVGTEIDLTAQQANAPKLAYYDFSHFAINKMDAEASTTLTVDKNTTVYANYEYGATADMFKLALVNIGTYGNAIFGESTLTIDDGVTQFTDADSNVVGELKYNDRVTLDPAKYACDFDIEDYNFSVDVNGQKYDALDIGRDFDAVVPVSAFVQVKVPEGEFEKYLKLLNTPSLQNEIGFEQAEIDEILTQVPDLEMEVINYSDTYSFYVHEDAIIVGLTQDELTMWKNAGVIANDYTITITDKVRKNNDGTMSIVGTYCLPQGAEIVENGVLFTASKKTISVDKLTLAEASQNGKIARYKSTLHTIANQYVTTVNITTAGTYNIKYCGYLTYKLNGQTYTVYSNTQDGTFTVQ